MTAQSQPPAKPPAASAAPVNPNDVTHPGQTFSFVPGYDSPGNTILSGVYMPEQVCNTVAGCIGYNSNGDLKSAIVPESQWVGLTYGSNTQGGGNLPWNKQCGTASNAGLYIGTDSNFPYSSYQFGSLPPIPSCVPAGGFSPKFSEGFSEGGSGIELNRFGTPRVAISW
jgi:hypothetical protein